MSIVYYALVAAAIVLFFMSLGECVALAQGHGRWRVAAARAAAGSGCAGIAVLMLGRLLPVVDGLGGTVLLLGGGALLLVALAALVAGLARAWVGAALCLVPAAVFGIAEVGVNLVRDVYVRREPLEVAVEFMKSGRGKFCLPDSAGPPPPGSRLGCQAARLQPAVDSLAGTWSGTGTGPFGVSAQDVRIDDSPFLPPDVWITERKLQERTDSTAVALLLGHYAVGASNERVTLDADISFTATVALVSRQGVWFVRELTVTR
ncbi:MAG: hypothetical protein FJX74_17800 [Armatimonadetes bacterium]|nr:hypothetical protein [Armatimonadota bacterium]